MSRIQASPNLCAFLDMLAFSEGTSTSPTTRDEGYDQIVGRTRFTSYADHPNVKVALPRLGISSTAAGRYQLLHRFWIDYRDLLEQKGIDAILNIKGFAGEKGLEYYSEIKVVNMGAQVLVPELVSKARAEKADAVLVSQVVTQRDAHLHNTREMSAAFNEAYPSGSRPLLVVGGPRFDETMTSQLGVDRIFGKGTTPGEVASFLVHALLPA